MLTESLPEDPITQEAIKREWQIIGMGSRASVDTYEYIKCISQKIDYIDEKLRDIKDQMKKQSEMTERIINLVLNQDKPTKEVGIFGKIITQSCPSTSSKK